jgi:hypothetical protein
VRFRAKQQRESSAPTLRSCGVPAQKKHGLTCSSPNTSRLRASSISRTCAASLVSHRPFHKTRRSPRYSTAEIPVAVAWDGAMMMTMTVIGDATRQGGLQPRLSRGLFGENLSAPQGRSQSAPREATQLFFGNRNFAVTSEQQWHQATRSTTPFVQLGLRSHSSTPCRVFRRKPARVPKTRSEFRVSPLALSYFARVSPDDSDRHTYFTTIKHLALLPRAQRLPKLKGWPLE